MPLTLTSGNESRTAGAPFIPLDRREEYIRLRARELMIQNELLDEHTALRQAQAEVAEGAAARQAMEARLAQGAADRQRQQAQRRGVDPESLPADEYGAVSARTVRDANLPLDEQEERQGQYDRLASDEIKAMREGRFHGAEAQARQYEQDYGLPTNPSSTGKTDLDYLREIQQQQGFIRTGSGEMIPVGPAITPEAIASRRDFNEWANETPGTERQALYDPAGYEQHREGVRQEIQDRARRQMADEGTGPTDEDTRGDLGLPALTDAQLAARDRRDDSESRVRAAQRGRFYRDKLMVDAGVAPPALGPDATTDDLERAAFRNRYSRRQADLDARKQALRDQRMLLAPGGRGVVNAINQLPDDWRRIAILDRITEGRVGGPTPLGVDAVGAQNALRLMGNRYLSGQQGQNGIPPGSLQWEAALAQQPIEVQAAVVRQQNGGVLPADSRAGMAVLDKIEDEVIGLGWGGNANVDRAVRRAVEMGIDPAEAEQRFRHRRYQDVPPRGVPEGVDPDDPRAWGPAPPGWAGRWPPE